MCNAGTFLDRALEKKDRGRILTVMNVCVISMIKQLEQGHLSLGFKYLETDLEKLLEDARMHRAYFRRTTLLVRLPPT